MSSAMCMLVLYLLHYHGESLVAVCTSVESAEDMRKQYLSLAKLEENNSYYHDMNEDDLMSITPVVADQYMDKYVQCTDIVLPQRTK